MTLINRARRSLAFALLLAWVSVGALYAAVSQTLPTPTADSTAYAVPTRTGKYGEAYTLPLGKPRDWLAAEGSYYTVQNAADDTQITAHAAPAVADLSTKPLLHFFNSNAAGGKSIYLDYCSLYTIVANASATRVFFDGYVDNKGSTSVTSGGTAATPVNVLSTNSTASGAVVTAGAVASTMTTPRKIFHSMVRPSIGIALDQYHFGFGDGLRMAQGAMVAATVQSTYTAGPPIIIAPGSNFGLVQISPSGAATAMTFEYQCGYYER